MLLIENSLFRVKWKLHSPLSFVTKVKHIIQWYSASWNSLKELVIPKTSYSKSRSVVFNTTLRMFGSDAQIIKACLHRRGWWRAVQLVHKIQANSHIQKISLRTATDPLADLYFQHAR